jgi:fructose-bisphosphate aldolase, class I
VQKDAKLNVMDKEILYVITEKLVAPGKGIFAADATESTMDKRLQKAGIEPSPEIRRFFREMLLKTEGIGDFISGVILNDEIIRQKVSDGGTFQELITGQGIYVGIKVDKKTHDMANFPGEKIAEGLDGLRDRLKEYKEMGASFAKFRTVITIGQGIPSQTCIDSNSEVLARYAALCQENDIVPIVEPEVVMDGDHSFQRCEDVTRATLSSTFKYLDDHKVHLRGIILKPNMVLPGVESNDNPSLGEIAEVTLQVLKRTVPPDVTGVVFLSGGQKAEDATLRLSEMNKIKDIPWKLSFSFERALEGPAMDVWKGKEENIQSARKEFYKRAKLNSLASQGGYAKEMENEN